MKTNKNFRETLEEYNPELLENKQLTVELLEKYIEEIFFSKVNKTRKVEMRTGRGGAIQNYIYTQAAIYPDKDLKEIKEETDNMIWEDGVYTIDETGCHYEGLWDYEMKDGTYIIKRNNLWYKEVWKNGYRYKYQIISEKAAQELINNI